MGELFKNAQTTKILFQWVWMGSEYWQSQHSDSGARVENMPLDHQILTRKGMGQRPLQGFFRWYSHLPNKPPMDPASLPWLSTLRTAKRSSRWEHGAVSALARQRHCSKIKDSILLPTSPYLTLRKQDTKQTLWQHWCWEVSRSKFFSHFIIWLMCKETFHKLHPN